MALDRISGLPPPILQQILCFLSQKNAVRTCVLSKTWRHQWCTRPKVEFREKSFEGKQQTFESVADKTLQRYLDQNLSLPELRLRVNSYSEPAAELLRKWIPKLKILDIYLRCSRKFHIPSSVFEAEYLKKLYLEGCSLYRKGVVDVVICKHLKTLHFVKVHIADETFKKIISSCPLIESVTFDFCRGLGTIFKVDDKLRNLKHFEFITSLSDGCIPSIEVDIPSIIERIRITHCPVLFRNDDQRNLKSLSLTRVGLSSELLDLFSWNNMPSLEFLELVDCDVFKKEFNLSSRSIKHLVFEHYVMTPIIKATIDAPNILSFKYSTFFLPSVFSFTKTNSSHEWKSNVTLKICDNSSWSLKLYQLLKELSGSEISLFLCKLHPWVLEITEDVLLQDKLDKNPVIVEHLQLWLPDESNLDSNSDFVNQLLGICHPRILVGGEKTDGFLRKFLVMDTGNKRKRHCNWHQDLEDVSMENYGFRLKWRES